VTELIIGSLIRITPVNAYSAAEKDVAANGGTVINWAFTIEHPRYAMIDVNIGE